jgi:hypothetical protein
MWVKTWRNEKEEEADPEYENSWGAPTKMKMNVKLRTNSDIK